jgi:hypothetical protein
VYGVGGRRSGLHGRQVLGRVGRWRVSLQRDWTGSGAAFAGLQGDSAVLFFALADLRQECGNNDCGWWRLDGVEAGLLFQRQVSRAGVPGG